MSGSAAEVAILTLVVFLGGVVSGVIVLVSMAIKREDRKFSLLGEAPDLAARGARILTGAGTRGGSVKGR